MRVETIKKFESLEVGAKYRINRLSSDDAHRTDFYNGKVAILRGTEEKSPDYISRNLNWHFEELGESRFFLIGKGFNVTKLRDQSMRKVRLISLNPECAWYGYDTFNIVGRVYDIIDEDEESGVIELQPRSRKGWLTVPTLILIEPELEEL